MKRSKLILFFVLIASFSFAQFKNNKWLMGYGNPPAPNNGTKIEFNNNVRIVSYDPRQMWFSWNFSGLNDKDDNWFVYTNGGAVCNKNHEVLVNGLGLSPGVMTQVLLMVETYFYLNHYFCLLIVVILNICFILTEVLV
jgi:hypothetical protein